MKKLFLNYQVQEYENAFFNKGNSDKELMLKAADVASKFIIKNTDYKKFICVCGPGNNGGDGYYIGISLSRLGFKVSIIDALNEKKKSPLCNDAFDEANKNKLMHDASILNEGSSKTAIVDAVFGTSLKGPLNKSLVDLINSMNSYDQIFSIDIPSGINPNTGVELETSICANKTISFVGRKVGLALNQGKISAGEINFHDLGLNMKDEIKEFATSYKFLDIKDLIVKRSANTHKGNYGRILVIGGDENMGGAAIMASEMALKSGSGLVSLLTQKDHIKASLERNPEIMAISFEALKNKDPILETADVVVCGPGLSESLWSEELIKKTMQHLTNINSPAIFDAGALRYIAKDPNSIKGLNGSIILTPHPGEAAALLSISTNEVQLDRIEAAKKLALKYNATIILKGSGTIIVHKDKIYVCEEGGPELATGGTGDILAGLVGSLIAQGLSEVNASLLAVATHGAAGNEFMKLHGENGLAATELIPLIRKKLNNK